MNDENLMKNRYRSGSEAREGGKKGGIASGQVRRRKKALRTVLREALHICVGDIADKGARDALMKASGSNDDSKTVGEIVIDGLILSSVRGNSQMMKLLFELIGENPTIDIKRKELKLKEKALENGSAGAMGAGDAEDVVVYLPGKEEEP